MDLAWIALIAGLLLFLGGHSLRLFAEGWRARQIERLGEKGFKGLYSLVAIAGFLLLLWGYAQARQGLAPLFTLPGGRGLRHAVALLMLPAFWLMVAAYVPRNHLKTRLQHPMILSVKLWALAHLLVNHNAADLLLFGGFLAWAVLDFRAARWRPTQSVIPSWPATLLTLLLGSAAYAGFAFGLHLRWLGVAPV